LPWGLLGLATRTLGGVLATGALSDFPLFYGDISHYVVSLQLVTSDGAVVEIPNRWTPVYEAIYTGAAHQGWWQKLAELLGQQRDTLLNEQNPPWRCLPGYRLWATAIDALNREGHTGRAIVFRARRADRPVSEERAANTTGLSWSPWDSAVAWESSHLAEATSCRSEENRKSSALEHDIDHLKLNPAQIFLASEGTLGVITEVEIRPPESGLALGLAIFFFDRFEDAFRALGAIAPASPAGCYMVDGRHLSLSRGSDPYLEQRIPSEAQSALLVHCLAPGPRALRQSMEELSLAVRTICRPVSPEILAVEETDRQRWKVLHHPAPPVLYRLAGASRPVSFVDHVAVPPDRLEQFLPELYRLLRQTNLTGPLFCSPLDGRVAVRPVLDLANRQAREALWSFAENLYQTVLAFGGTITAGAGWGLAHSVFLAQQYPRLCETMTRVKEIFDPAGVLNPGKIVGAGDISEFRDLFLEGSLLRLGTGGGLPVVDQTRGKRRQLPGEAVGREQSRLLTQLHPLGPRAETCFLCGECRYQLSPGRMCPIYRSHPVEEASPRAKANLVRHFIRKGAPPAELSSSTFREIAELCVHCHMCGMECPAQVDVPGLMTELKGQHTSVAGLLFSDWVMVHLDTLARLGMFWPKLANWILRTGWTRWLLEKTMGIAQGRKLPPLARQTFLEWALRANLTRSVRPATPKVAYFVDLFVNFFAPALGQCVVAVFQHNGISLHVPEKQQQAGTPAFAVGALDRARKLAVRNLRVLANVVRQGYDILATEPAAVVTLQKEYPQLLPSPEADLVAKHVTDACAYLWRLHQQGKINLDFRPVPLTIGYHQPCRLKALGIGSPGERLLRLIPGLQVTLLPDACSGMAGTYGLKATSYRASLRVGFPVIATLRQSMFHAGATECSACRIQLEQGAGKPVFHPLELLACAYGLVELQDLFRQHSI
jgi:Fe-S oxidoreductase/FAD/FMN-containing dehydrogenase